MICLRVHLNALKAVGNQTAEPRQLGQRSWSFSGHRSDFVLTFFFLLTPSLNPGLGTRRFCCRLDAGL